MAQQQSKLANDQESHHKLSAFVEFNNACLSLFASHNNRLVFIWLQPPKYLVLFWSTKVLLLLQLVQWAEPTLMYFHQNNIIKAFK